MRKTIGVLAHVDAGKTTLSEQVLYCAGAIRTPGRVDHCSSFLDLNPLERERGITIFSDQAFFDVGENRYYWLDTPGHSDFSPEMERALMAMDYALLVVSCVDGVQSHTETIWQLLQEKEIPTLIFINKCDRPESSFSACLREMQERLCPDIADMRGFDGSHMDIRTMEALAERDEEMLEHLAAGNEAAETWRQGLVRALQERRIFPAFGGSALNSDGVEHLLKAMDAMTDTRYDATLHLPMAARIYKLRCDPQGGRKVYLKILQGKLRVRDEVETPRGKAKISALYLCHGSRSTAIPEAIAGDLVWTPGLEALRVGEGLGAASAEAPPHFSEAMMEVSIEAQGRIPRPQFLEALRMLEAEDPSLCVSVDSHGPALRVMGEIQTQILSRLMQDRFGIAVTFGAPRILYKETIADSAIGIGHYEPLRHYAEVWLRLSPGPRGSGIRFESRCHVDELALNWQRLIETHVFERAHPGVLIGAPLTDVKIELLAGRAHLKHTEGGDFRESCYRAIRNALMQAQSVLLEPVCFFALRLPAENLGRVLSDLQRMQAQTQPPRAQGEWMLLEGECPYRQFASYPDLFRAQTHGRGNLRIHLSHYAPANNAAEIIASAHYSPLETDTPDSIFCSHGAGHVVPWNEVRTHAHCRVDLPEGD